MSVKFTNNIDLLSKEPNFKRDQFTTKAEMKACNPNFIDEGHKSYCLEDGKTYEFKSSNTLNDETGYWREFGGGSGDGLYVGDTASTKPIRVDNDNYSVAIGSGTTASGKWSFARGLNSVASGMNSCAEGVRSYANGYCSHAEGYDSKAYGSQSHAEGTKTQAKGNYSHAEGNYTIATGENSHSEGYESEAYGDYSHAEGSNTLAQADYTHAEGYESQAKGWASHAEGWATKALNEVTHAEGDNTTANNYGEHAEGVWNISHTDEENASGRTVFSHGNGAWDEDYVDHTTGNAIEVMENGDVYISGKYYQGSFEDTDKKPIVPVSYNETDNTLTVDTTVITLGGNGDCNASLDIPLNLIKVTQNGVTFVVPAVRLEKPSTPTLSDVTTLAAVNTADVTVSCATNGVTMYYTIDGTDPTTGSSTTTDTIVLDIDKTKVSKDYVVKVMASKNGMTSEIASKTYTTKRKLVAPTFGTVSGTEYSTSRTVTISGPSGATIKYKLGSTGSWQTYSTTITADTTVTIYAKAEMANWEDSSEETKSITVGTKKMYYGAVASKPTTLAEIQAMNSLEAKTFPQDITFTESGYNYGCFAYNKNLGELGTIWEYASNANMLDATNPNWEKVGEVDNYIIYASKKQSDFSGAKFGMRK